MSAMQKFNRMLSTLVFATIVLINMALVTNANAEDIEDRLIRSAYAAGGKTLYCQTPFKPGDRIKVDYIYSENNCYVISTALRLVNAAASPATMMSAVTCTISTPSNALSKLNGAAVYSAICQTALKNANAATSSPIKHLIRRTTPKATSRAQ